MRNGLFSLFALLGALAVVGCRTLPSGDPVSGESYKPSNVHRSAETLPATVRRVAVLPLTASGDRPGLEAGASTIGPLLAPQLGASGLVEAVEVSASDLARWTGRPKLRLVQELPAGVLESIRQQTGCDAVLFGDLIQFSAFPPLSIGLRLSLVEVQSGRILWSVDEVLDAGNPAVASGARRYFQSSLKGPGTTPFDSQTVLDSPTRFGRYAITTLLGTIPGRQAGNR